MDGTPYTALNVLEIDLKKGGYKVYQLFRDYLGSVTHVRGSGALDMYTYDPWGNLQNPATGEVYTSGEEPRLRFGRGYTGHEHLPEFGLINMNARLYDPVTGRFLAPDPYISDPDNPWAYNRYAYALNNPVHFSDPDGENPLVILGIGLLLGKTYYDEVKSNHGQKNPFKWDWKKTNFSVSAGYNTSGKFSGSMGMGFNNNYMVNAGWNNGVSVGYTLNGESRMARIDLRGSTVRMDMENINNIKRHLKWQADTEQRIDYGIALMTSASISTGSIAEAVYSKHFGTYYSDNTFHKLDRVKKVKAKMRANAANKLSVKIKNGGRIFSFGNGAYSLYQTIINGELSYIQGGLETGSAIASGFLMDNAYGMAWSIGWEAGRAITTTQAYRNFKLDIFCNSMILMYGLPSQENQFRWEYFIKNYDY